MNFFFHAARQNQKLDMCVVLTSHQNVEHFHNGQVTGKQSSSWLCAPKLYTIFVCTELDEIYLSLYII